MSSSICFSEHQLYRIIGLTTFIFMLFQGTTLRNSPIASGVQVSFSISFLFSDYHNWNICRVLFPSVTALLTSNKTVALLTSNKTCLLEKKLAFTKIQGIAVVRISNVLQRLMGLVRAWHYKEIVEHLKEQDLVEGIGHWGHALEEFCGFPVEVLMLFSSGFQVSRFLLAAILPTSPLPSTKVVSQLIMNWKALEIWFQIYTFLGTWYFFRCLFQRQKGIISMQLEVKYQPSYYDSLE